MAEGVEADGLDSSLHGEVAHESGRSTTRALRRARPSWRLAILAAQGPCGVRPPNGTSPSA